MATKKTIRAPRLTSVQLGNLVENEDTFFGPGESYDGQRFDRPNFAGTDLTSTDFLDCELSGPAFDNAQLRGTRFRDSIIADSYAPVFKASRTSWRDVEIRNPRWGSAELYDSTWQSVRIDGGKLDFLNIRSAKITDLCISDCIIGELDLGGAKVTRMALQNCRIGTLDIQQATLTDFDVRSTDFRTLNGIGSMAGTILDEYQLGLLAPLLAAHLGITVA
ncbi:pentapeptide repeat-containing protein [Arthrobacter cryoconiti]|uniref:Pentapeptide repeat-containing protein n=1 Tax=Arthrobacter cryoconiti TaxID=748907 RepID=A0ABV8R2E5_9MICC|nr:pentapeptide repeat-containing protein [Arthrobacter cryoconiti]MCC9067996.1 pentapeptide repeat-containing protein [Arthrobacter cryoconiti]